MLIRSMERQHQLVVELARLATIDPLTGLVTRRSFDEAVAAAWHTATATKARRW